MLFYTVGQSRVFVMMLCVGLGIGAWYGLWEILRALQQAGTLLSLAMDMLFGAGAAALIIWGAMRVSYGELRPYALLGAVCGCVLFFGAVRPPARFLGRQAARLIRRVRARPHPIAEKIFR